MGGYTYVMTNKPFGTLYIGVTSDIAQRVAKHKAGTGSDFCQEHGLRKLVYLEWHDEIDDAISREKAMKAWKRRWKTDLIAKTNPDWRDLYEELNR
mgnify:CR=1 FL=1